jgi:hypothetical protein
VALDPNDWRLTQGADEFLRGAELVWKPYRAWSPDSEHDHCCFCWAKFMDPEFSDVHRQFIADNSEVLTEGYTTTDAHPDGAGSHWVCSPCFEDFRGPLGLKVAYE